MIRKEALNAVKKDMVAYSLFVAQMLSESHEARYL